ncbi:MAG TPA: galactose oxidase-like domain-containing protein [Propionibacteriaceae bacterium]|nr:galactose oxidase-like domain-containing protein [Propionibacteriaceae bacterium]
MDVRTWRGWAAAAMLGGAFSLLGGTQLAAAHGGEPETDEQHAAQDRAGVPMSTIEQETRVNAARIKKATGAAPGGRTKQQQVSNERTSMAAATDPGQGGQWSPVISTPVVPVFQAVLPNGKVLIWDSVGDESAEQYPDHTSTRAIVWDPVSDTSKPVDVANYNIFCAGFVQLADGRVLVAGGNKDANLAGIVQTHLFDWRTESWTRGPDMSSQRWYPSLAALANGEALIVAGGPATAEVYQTDGKLRRLTGFSSFKSRIYPFLVPRPNGQVEMVGPNNPMHTMTTTGAGALTATQARDTIYRSYGSFATYDIGKALVAGGGSVTEGGQSQVPTKTASVVDVSANKTTVRSTGSMSVGRRQHNLTVLADGSVLATGGQSSSVNGLVDLEHPVFAAERWDPATDSWTVLSSASRVRQYHSAASLLPDGRVLTGGGGICGTCTTKGYLEKNLEYFTPPYLYKSDGSGELADRPVIDSAPSTLGFGRQFGISTPQATSIKKVGLVRLGAATHSVDQGQRYVPLSFTVTGSVVTASAPATAQIAPPGYYMMFVTDEAGVPSVAKIVKVSTTYAAVASPVTASDYDGDGDRDLAVWRPSTGTWYVRGVAITAFGQSGDQPVPADYGGDGITDMAVWRPSTGEWRLRGIGNTTYGRSGDKPVPADYDGDGRTDIAVWRPSTGTWHVQGKGAVSWGVDGDIPVPADYNGDGRADLAVWRPSTGAWYVRGAATTYWGVSGDKPAPADYTGDGRTDIAVWRPSTGTWYLRNVSKTTYGVSTDRPVPGDYDGDGTATIAVWRPTTGKWYLRNEAGAYWGRSDDQPV